MPFEIMNVVELFEMLGEFYHWRVQVVQCPKRGIKRYECTIRDQHHVYTASAAMPMVAIDRACAKARIGKHKGLRIAK